DAAEHASLTGYAAGPGADGVVAVDPAYVASQRPRLASLRALLAATAGRAANFGCFGLHEWAMVYRLSEDET
ncbi:3-methyladenine DNA glycosylase, partial [Nocardioides sp. SOB72]|nr:3-methyladenine DNA glycosylase [Nocardioides abyssi]